MTEDQKTPVGRDRPVKPAHFDRRQALRLNRIMSGFVAAVNAGLPGAGGTAKDS